MPEEKASPRLTHTISEFGRELLSLKGKYDSFYRELKPHLTRIAELSDLLEKEKSRTAALIAENQKLKQELSQFSKIKKYLPERGS